MLAVSSLPDRWRALFASDGEVMPGVVETGADLLARWAEPHRRYHNQTHLAECLSLLDDLDYASEAAIDDRLTLELALWFHDAIYEPQATDNEAASAALAETQLTALRLPASQIERVHALVLATDYRQPATVPDGEVIRAIDVAVLGAEAARFERYDHDIREEYAWVAAADYQAGRARVLQHLADAVVPTAGAVLGPAWVERAHANLVRALAGLS